MSCLADYRSVDSTMPIPVSCGGCGKRFSAPDRGAGKKVPCPACKSIISIPAVVDDAEEDDYRLADLPPPAAAPSTKLPVPASDSGRSTLPTAQPRPGTLPPMPGAAESAPKRAWVPPTAKLNAHLAATLALVPGAGHDSAGRIHCCSGSSGGSARHGDHRAAARRLRRKRATASDGDGLPAESLEQMSVDALFAALPGHKLPGAFLGSQLADALAVCVCRRRGIHGFWFCWPPTNRPSRCT